MRLLHEAAYALGEPVISARLATVDVHALLDDRPGAVVRDDEPVQVEIEAVLDERAVHLGDEPAGARQRLSIDAGPFSELHQLGRRATRVTAAAAADGQADLTLAPGEAPLERASTLVVIPLECQSIPITHPSAWNQNGCARRRRTPCGPSSSTSASTITPPRRAMRDASQSGT